ncbi:MAG: L,D-transpeptidase [Gammaproteobacteria bacterium]|jgi:L,D-transpeptidase ErfK/SrfK|nr:L,D-transpeptidase [Gammaproteobacteria bacterium]
MKSRTMIRHILITLIIPIFSMGQMYEISPESDLIGEIYTIKVSSNISAEQLAKSQNIGYQELKLANPSIGKIVKKGETVIIPAMYILPPKKFRHGLVINIAEPRLYYFTSDGQFVFTTPIAVGRSGWRTPLFSGSIIDKKPRPTWRPPESIRKYYLKTHQEELPEIIPPGPKNPLGNYAIYTSEARILIHGTNDEDSIGKYASSGCIRLYNQDIQTLFRIINVNDSVTIIHMPIKTGLHFGDEYIEVHPSIFDANYEHELNILKTSSSKTSRGIPIIR